MAYPRFQLARSFKVSAPYRGANVLVNGVAYADIPTILATMDIVLAAQVGDVCEVVLSGMWGAEAVESYLDVVTVAGGNYFHGGANNGIQGGYGESGVARGFTAVGHYALVAADLASGAVTLRPRAKTAAAANKTFFGGAWGFMFTAKNLGPVDPN